VTLPRLARSGGRAAPPEAGPARLLRSGIQALAALAALGVAAELASLRHWQGSQLIAWIALGANLLALLLVAAGPRRAGVLVARALAAIVVASALYGVWVHVKANYDTAPLDAVFGTRWPTLSEPERWWAAANGEAGPAPPLAPLVLAQVALTILLATVHHPALDIRDHTD
jgi:hypothetical protein